MNWIRTAAAATVLALGLASGVARAEQKLGVDVYRKAEVLALKTAFVKQAAGVDAGCYRTADRFDSVKAFYARMPGFVSVEPNLFRRAGVDVVLHPPQDAKTGAVGRYTVFCIMQSVN